MPGCVGNFLFSLLVVQVDELVERYFNAIQSMAPSFIHEYTKHLAFCNALTKLDRRVCPFSVAWLVLVH